VRRILRRPRGAGDVESNSRPRATGAPMVKVDAVRVMRDG
jgi:hypothetical protein